MATGVLLKPFIGRDLIACVEGALANRHRALAEPA